MTLVIGTRASVPWQNIQRRCAVFEIEVEKVDSLYEMLQRAGVPVGFSLFDKRVLLPLCQLIEAVHSETGQPISERTLREKAAAGWYPLLSGAGWDGTEEGAPGYVPPRIGILMKLERDGYSPAELREIAGLEEWTIDNVLTVDDLAYFDDDLETLITWWRVDGCTGSNMRASLMEKT